MPTNQQVALKVFTITDSNSNYLPLIYQREIQALSNLNTCSNIINMAQQPFKCKRSSQTTYIIPLKYAPFGSLLSVLNNEPLEERYARYVFKQILSSVEASHNCQIAHRDLKLENILINEKHQLCLTDFGYSNIGQNASYLAIGTQGYMAPEVYKNTQYDPFKIDIFSLGVILFKLITGDQQLFGNSGPHDPLYKPLLNGSPSSFWKMVEKRFSVVKTISIQLRLLLSSMIHPEPSKRFSIGKIKTNAWLKGPTISTEEFIIWTKRSLESKAPTRIEQPIDGEEDFKLSNMWKLFSQIVLSALN